MEEDLNGHNNGMDGVGQEEEKWSIYTFAIQAEAGIDYMALFQCIYSGVRNKFTAISRDQLVEEALSTKNPTPLQAETKAAINSDQQAAIDSCVARLFRARIEEDEQAFLRRIAEAKQAEYEANGGKGENGEDTPRTAKLKKGNPGDKKKGGDEKPKEADKRPKSPDRNPKTPDKKKAAAPAPDKGAAKKKGKRGKDDEEERLVPVEFDDAPSVGPVSYYLLHGFASSIDQMLALAQAGVDVDVVIYLKTITADQNAALAAGKVAEPNPQEDQNAPTRPTVSKESIASTPRLRDLIWIEIFEAHLKDTKALYTELATELYKTVEQKKVYQKWLQTVNLMYLPTIPAAEVDMQLYNQSLSCIPSDLQSISVMMDCLLEQIVHNEKQGSKVENENSVAEAVLGEIFAASISELKPEDAVKQVTSPQAKPTPERYRNENEANFVMMTRVQDEVTEKTCLVENIIQPTVSTRNVEQRLLGLSTYPGRHKVGAPLDSSMTDDERVAEKSEFISYLPQANKLSVYRYFSIFDLENYMADAFGFKEFNFSDRVVEEILKPVSMGQIYQQLVDQNLQIMTYYNEIDEILLLGAHRHGSIGEIVDKNWRYQIPTKVGFAEWRKQNVIDHDPYPSHRGTPAPAHSNPPTTAHSTELDHISGTSDIVYDLKEGSILTFDQKIMYPADFGHVSVTTKKLSPSRSHMCARLYDKDITISLHTFPSHGENLGSSTPSLSTEKRTYASGVFKDIVNFNTTVDKDGHVHFYASAFRDVLIHYIDGSVLEQTRYTVKSGISLSSVQETARRVLSKGTLSRYMSDGTIETYFANGDTSVFDPKKRQFCITTIKGERYSVSSEGEVGKMEPIGVSCIIEPYSGCKVTTRADKIIKCQKPSGEVMIVCPDGSYITTTSDQAHVWIECDGFFPVQVDLHKKAILAHLGGSCIFTGQNNTVTFQSNEDFRVSITNQALIYQRLQQPKVQISESSTPELKNELKGVYEFSLVDGTLKMVDFMENILCVSAGVIKMEPEEPEVNPELDDDGDASDGGESEQEAEPINAFSPAPGEVEKEEVGPIELDLSIFESEPRLFVVRPDGNAFELHKASVLDALLEEAKSSTSSIISVDSSGENEKIETVTIVTEIKGSKFELKYPTMAFALPKITSQSEFIVKSKYTPIGLANIRQFVRYLPLELIERDALKESLEKYDEWRARKENEISEGEAIQEQPLLLPGKTASLDISLQSQESLVIEKCLERRAEQNLKPAPIFVEEKKLNKEKRAWDQNSKHITASFMPKGITKYFQSASGKEFLESPLASDMRIPKRRDKAPDAMYFRLQNKSTPSMGNTGDESPTFEDESKFSTHLLNDSNAEVRRDSQGKQKQSKSISPSNMSDQFGIDASLKTKDFDVYGNPRRGRMSVSLPPSHINRAFSQPNIDYQVVEGPVKRTLNTSSVSLIRNNETVETSFGSKVSSFHISQSAISFGIIRQNYTYRHTFMVTNVGLDTCRFRLDRIKSNDIQLLYSPGPVAAGMSTKIEVQICLSKIGEFSGQNVTIVTETDIIKLPITAHVKSPTEYESLLRAAGTKPLQGKNVRLVSTQPPGKLALATHRWVEKSSDATRRVSQKAMDATLESVPDEDALASFRQYDTEGPKGQQGVSIGRLPEGASESDIEQADQETEEQMLAALRD